MKSLFMSALLAVACPTVTAQCFLHNYGADGYKFTRKEYSTSSVVVNIVVYDTKEALLKSAKDRGMVMPSSISNEDLAAYSILSADKKSCTIHMIDPMVSYEPEFVGHEFLHCAYGQWHTNNRKKK